MTQKLSRRASIAKAKRDLLAAKTPNRRAKKAENQRIGQRSTSDIHHVGGKVGNTKRVSIANNRDTFKNGDRKKKKKTTKK